MSSMMNGRSGGFGGAPVYRSSHQQGTDGPPGSRRPRRSKTQEQRGRNDDRQHSSMCFRADVSIAASDRKRLIGPGGCIIKRLTRSTRANIHIVVPNKNKKQERGDDNQVRDDENEGTVYIKAATIASLLHALWRIVELLRVTVDAEDLGNHHHAAVTNIENIYSTITPRTLACQIRFLPDATPPVTGRLIMGTGTDPTSPFLVLENEFSLSAYCIILVTTTSAAEFTTTTTQQLETLLDNERFAHSEWSANSEIVECTFDSNNENEVSSVLIFIHGTESQYPKQLCQSLARSIREVFFTSDGHCNRRK